MDKDPVVALKSLILTHKILMNGSPDVSIDSLYIYLSLLSHLSISLCFNIRFAELLLLPTSSNQYRLSKKVTIISASLNLLGTNGMKPESMLKNPVNWVSISTLSHPQTEETS